MKLLLAEDERELSNALVAILKHNHYLVDAVYNGKDALDYILSDDYDGVILDIMMPIMDGLTVLKEIRGRNISVPVLILSAKSEVDDRVAGLDIGADDYLTKPFATKELLARVRAITRRPTNAVDATLQVGNVTLDCTNFMLSNGDKQVRLTSKEFQMMELLMQHPEQTFSTDIFMDKVWGYESNTEMNVVWVYISYLRKKLVKIEADLQICAVRNLGYHLKKC